MEPHGDAPRRKRKSRFSDAPAVPTAPYAKRQAVGSGAAPVLDPAALARAAAAKISRAIPGSGSAVNSAPNAAPSIPGAHIDQEELQRIEQEKKRRTDQIYKSVQSQMSHIKALLRKPGAPGAVGASTATVSGEAVGSGTFMPAPLLLDEQGREIDAAGNVVAEKPTVAPVATLKANQGVRGGDAAKKNQNPYLSHRTVDEEDKVEAVDPRLKVTKRETRARKTFNFVAQGSYVKQAEQVRARDAKKMMAGFTSGRNPRGYQKESIVAIDDSADPTPQDDEQVKKMEVDSVEVPSKPEMSTPDVEWWDVEYLPKDKRAMVDKFGFIKSKARKENPNATVTYADMKLKYCGTAHVIEHPVRLNLIVRHDNKPVAVPLMLTAAERKKIRRQNRADREKEKQDKIALGLLPPPEPKVKLSNMMRVLSEQAVADPSAIERKVREQIAQREKNHEMRNLARKLTPEERREKKLRKIKEDAAGDIHVALFKYVLCALFVAMFHDRATNSIKLLLLKRVPDLSNPQHRFKVDVNAQQYHLTGGVLLCKDSDINMVVVEGGKKAIKQYTKLMMRRIDWNGAREAEHESDSEDEDTAKRGNGCLLVWQGVVARKAFNNFRFQECRTTVTARKVMEAKNVAHYWDLVEKSAETAAAAP
ncbi:U4/U6 small nuclear ribonucleoprotein Prp3 [Phytophthora citrophthora]|uniref:U4/U6 small nuclear ribonucleoprotein Prp3 n=1 Tax=Phytophthora citrophthora TaxID=4793 RepID=A0AAD9H1G2_9STRA|nr:U4/U6 small nuclear ribonucleoprotein Prp3 [Phytophthora citrophthora]